MHSSDAAFRLNIGLRTYPFIVDNASRFFSLVKSVGVLYSLAVVLPEEFYRHIRRDSAGNSTTVYFFVYKY